MKTLALILLMFVVNAQPLVTARETCSVRFSVENAGFDVEGTLDVARTEIRFDPNQLKKSSVEIILDPSSIETGIDIRNKHLKRSDYFDVARFPEIRVRSTGFRRKNKNEVVGEFSLTIKSVTKQISIPIEIKEIGDVIAYEAIFQVNRLDFGVGEESLTLDNTINITAYGEVNILAH
jgi:polyisoprenoid-binding protein YceI